MSVAFRQSLTRSSGVWFATCLSVFFALAQANGLHFDRAFLVGLSFWTIVGLSLDAWGRRLSVMPEKSLRDVIHRPLACTMLAGLGLAVVGTILRPSETTPEIGSWIATANGILNRAEIVLPGLRNGRAALDGAGRQDVAAYFGLFQVITSIGWLAALVVWTRAFNVLSANASYTTEMNDDVRKAYSPWPKPWRYFWRAAHASLCWSAFLLAFVVLNAYWHQEVVGESRFWHNAISGGGAYVPGPFALLFGAPLCVFGGMSWRAALREQSRQ
ncbi:MAG: hypothetical protein ACKOEC_20825 [Acidimicrobiia bacterium]